MNYDRNYYKNSEAMVNENFERFFSTKEAQIKDVRPIKEVNKSTQFINKKFNDVLKNRAKKNLRF